MMNTKTLKTSIVLFALTAGLALSTGCAGSTKARPGMAMPRTPGIEQQSRGMDRADAHADRERIRPTHEVDTAKAIVCPPSRGV